MHAVTQPNQQKYFESKVIYTYLKQKYLVLEVLAKFGIGAALPTIITTMVI